MARLVIGSFFAMNAMIFGLVLAGDFVYPLASSSGAELAPLFRALALVFSVPAFALLAPPVLGGARGSATRATDALILLGTGSAFLVSAWHVLRGSGPVYFETATGTLAFLSLGRYLEARGRARATRLLEAAAALLPREATRLRAGEPERVPAGSLVEGDEIFVTEGQAIAADGVVLAGEGEVDVVRITGDPLPARRSAGGRVLAGTTVLRGSLRVRVTAGAGERVADRIEAAMERARRERAPLVRAGERIAGWMIPGVAVLALAVFAWQALEGNAPEGIRRALAVLLVACPCALGAAAPLAFWAGTGRAARRGILFHDAAALERLASIRGVCFDKTGTLTSRELEVVALRAAPGWTEGEVLRLAARAESGSDHPIAAAVLRRARAVEPGLPRIVPLEVETRAGRGVLATLEEGVRVAVGSRAWLEEMGARVPDGLSGGAGDRRGSGDGARLVFVARATAGAFEGVGALAVTETLRPEAPGVIASLRRAGIGSAVLTGDEGPRAKALGEALGIPVREALGPEEKALAIGRAEVAMVGDGLNDAAALGRARVGIAIGAPADLVNRSADITIPEGGLRHLPALVALARRTRRVVRQNFAWAFVYNAVLLVAAAAGALHPVPAAAVMALSSAFVIANSLRLSHESPGEL
jgi:heavy metal translocating P-type ATPase